MTEKWTREKVLELGQAFWLNRTLLTAVELNLFSKLSKVPKSVDELCLSEGWNSRSLTILLDALTALGMLTKTEDSRYKTRGALEDLLSDSGADSVLPMLLHMAHLWKSWSDLTEIVRGGEILYGAGNHTWSEEETEAFIGAMDVIARKMADTVAADLVDLTQLQRLLDVGGGPGTYTVAFLSRYPRMTATLFDRRQVVDLARERLEEKGLISRVRIVEGDFNAKELPNGHDLVWGSAIIHGNSRSENQELFRKIFACLDPGGRVLLRDHFLDDTRTSPVDGAVFAVNMLAVTKEGNCYTFNEVKEDLEDAGFHEVKMIRTGTRMDQIVSAAK